MITSGLSATELAGVFAVPPLARRRDSRRTLDFEQNHRIVRHIAGGGISRFLYGGNAFLYHLTLVEFDQLTGWLSELPAELLVIPSIGPAYGRAIDQAMRLRGRGFRTAMVLPCGDPRDARGLEQGLREIAETAEMPLILYLKEETGFGPEPEAGLDAVGRLVESGVCTAIKYAVVRSDPRVDPYLESLLARVGRTRVVSGLGERPAVVHMRDWNLSGFTTGSGCVAPRSTNSLHEACSREDYESAEAIRKEFLGLEDLRDVWGPARVLHSAIEGAGIARTGPTPPYVSDLSPDRTERVANAAKKLAKRDAGVATPYK
jgi:dihydrodipicolinate synthase/N-acetylneuraminate lyase